MFHKLEVILTIVLCIIGLLFLIDTLIKLVRLIKGNNERVLIWHGKVSVYFKIAKVLLLPSQALLLPGVIYYLFIVFLGSSTVRDFARYLFIITFSLWTFMAIYLCFSISEKLYKGSKIRQALFGLFVIMFATISSYLFSVLIKTSSFPPEKECVVLELPFNGVWIAGHAGATSMTNSHLKNRYAIDFLKLGSDNRFYKKKEDLVSDFYSYNEPIYSPANAKVTQVVDSLESDLMFQPDTVNIGGNYVILDIGDEKYVYLGHLKKLSIAIKTGDSVSVGTYIGSVGNSGNSSLPHLHMHVQNKPTSDPNNRITYPFRFTKIQRMRIAFWRTLYSSYLLRNDRVMKKDIK
jgi:hypothetical protein